MAPLAFYQDAQGTVVFAQLPWLEWWHIAVWAFMLGAVWWICDQQCRLVRIDGKRSYFSVQYAPADVRVGFIFTNESSFQVTLTARAEAIRDLSPTGTEIGRFRLVWEETQSPTIVLNPGDFATVRLLGYEAGEIGSIGRRHWFEAYGIFEGGRTSQKFALHRPDDAPCHARVDIMLLPNIPARYPKVRLECQDFHPGETWGWNGGVLQHVGWLRSKFLKRKANDASNRTSVSLNK